MLRTVHGNRRDRAGVNELCNVRPFGRVEKIFRTADVRIVNIPLAPCPEAVVGGDVENARHAVESAGQRSRIAQIASDIFERQIGNRAIVAGSAKQHANTFTARDELPRDVTAEEAGSSCNERGHAQSPSSKAFSPAEDNFCALVCALASAYEASKS